MENVNKRLDKPLDRYTMIKNTAERVLPFKMASVIALDLGTIYYCFFYWRKRHLCSHEFSYHKKHDTLRLLWFLIIMTLFEAVIVHIIVQQLSSTVAWILTAISLYSVMQLLGIIKSIPSRPISIENGNLNLRYGLISETNIAISNISMIKQNFGSIDFGGLTRSLSPFGFFEGHNVLINLKTNAPLNRVYGFNTTYKTIAFYVDDKNSFIETLKKNQLQ